ncbi:MAG: histidine phosphatase family protein, partial [Betaproteobacteria bacterium]
MPDEPVYRITLLRHAESIGNAEDRLQGHADYPLSERGRAQALALARRWKSEAITFDRVIASPLSRALETGQIIAAALELPPPETDPLWLERDTGEHSGMTWNEIEQRPAAERTAPREPVAAAGEGDSALFLRAQQALNSLLARPPARYLVASHRAILNMVLDAILGISPQSNSHSGGRFRLRNGAFSRLRFYPQTQRWQ